MAASSPSEIIQLIYGELRPDATESVAAALSVSAISRHWRAVALSTPFLWSRFSFSLRTHDEAMIYAFFERSLPKPLHLLISFDFPSADHIDIAKIERVLTLFLRNADRIQNLHVKFFTPMHDQRSILSRFLCFHSSGLNSLVVESLHGTSRERENWISELQSLVSSQNQTWSDRCPALTRVTCTDPRLLVNAPSNMTYMCIKGMIGRGDRISVYHLRDVLAGTSTLTELVIDGVALNAVYENVSFPHLHTLSLWNLPRRDTRGYHPADGVATFLQSLQAPALVSITIHAAIPYNPVSLDEWGFGVHIPSVTRFTVVPCASQFFSYYPPFLPGVEELVLIGSDSALGGIAGLSGDDWPRLHMIDLTNLDPPPRPKDLSETLCQYGHRRFQSGHRSRLIVILSRDILPRDLLLDVSEFMDLRNA